MSNEEVFVGGAGFTLRCPTCGGPVRIHSSGEGTNSYVPLTTEEQQARIQELEDTQNYTYLCGGEHAGRYLRDALCPYCRIQELEADRKWLSEEAFGLCGIITRHHDVKVLDLEPGARCPICRDKTPATLVRTIQVYLERRGH